MDYQADIQRHASWTAFLADPARRRGRIILFTTKGAEPLAGFPFLPGDTLLFGRESAGASDEVHAAAHSRLLIPLAPGQRSLNVVTAAAIALWEALRTPAQVGGD